MIRSKVQLLAASLVITLLFLSFRSSGKEPKVNLDELVSKHLGAMGSAEARAAVRVRSAKGKVTFDERISQNVHLEGTSFLVSQGPKLNCSLEFGAPQYAGEQFVYDGQKVQVAPSNQQSRSLLGNLLVTEPEILEEGLWGGSLNVAWPLLDRGANGSRLKYDGLEKVEGHDLYQVSYVPKNRTTNGEFEVHLYFEPRTFHHVLTVYRLSTAGPNMVTTTVEERFAGYQTSEGMTLPLEWEIRARIEPGKAQEFQWKITFTGITSIQAVAERPATLGPPPAADGNSSFSLAEDVSSFLPIADRERRFFELDREQFETEPTADSKRARLARL